MPEEIHGKRVAQVKTHHRKDTDGDAVVALEVPGDPLLAEMVCPTEVKDFFLHLSFSAEFRVRRAGLAVNQSLLANLLGR
jgi:hypothetical protein